MQASEIIRRFQDLIIGGKNKIIEKKTLERINFHNKQGYRIDLQKKLRNNNKWLEEYFFTQYNKFCNDALEIYKKTNQIYLLKTGQYFMKYSSMYLLFSQYHASRLIQTEKKGYYKGFKYKFDQYAYFGILKIYQNQILFEGEGQLHKKQQFYTIYRGVWSEGKIHKGEKMKYEGIQYQCMIEHYIGQFKDMKYNGNGLRKYKNRNNEFVTDEGEFQYGGIVKIKKIQ